MKKLLLILSTIALGCSGLIASCNKEEEAKPITEKPKNFAGVEAGATNEAKAQGDTDKAAASGPPGL